MGWLDVRHTLNAGQCCLLGQPQALDDSVDMRIHHSHIVLHKLEEYSTWHGLIHGPVQLEVSIVISSRTCSNEAVWFAMYQDAHRIFRWIFIRINPSHLPGNWHDVELY